MRTPLLLLLLSPLLFAGCDRFAAEEADEGHRGRIVLGQSVDGLRLGADTTDVYRLLGPPTAVDRKPGSVRFLYGSGRYAGIAVYYDLFDDGRPASRSAIFLEAPYGGRTEDGLGIGSTRAEVVAFLGLPSASERDGTGALREHYPSPSGSPLLFVYEDDRLIGLGMAGSSP